MQVEQDTVEWMERRDQRSDPIHKDCEMCSFQHELVCWGESQGVCERPNIDGEESYILN